MTRRRFHPRCGVGSYAAENDWQAPSETVEIECTIIRESDAAICVDIGREKVDPETGEITPDGIWFPKSQVRGREQSADGTSVSLTVTGWIAHKKGLV
ncbi:MAG: hypothetical protein ACRECF_08630 [Methyloceanibacter sp.]